MNTKQLLMLVHDLGLETLGDVVYDIQRHYLSFSKEELSSLFKDMYELGLLIDSSCLDVKYEYAPGAENELIDDLIVELFGGFDAV